MKKLLPAVFLVAVVAVTMAATFPFVRIPNLTTGRVVILDSAGNLTNDVPTSGTGALVRAGSPTITNATFSGTTEAETINADTLNLNSPISPLSCTVATLPAASVGAYVWCTDAITPWGVGGVYYLHESGWRESHTRIVATADVGTYLVDAFAQGWAGDTPLSAARWSSQVYLHPSGIGYLDSYFGSINGASSSAISGFNGPRISYSTAASASSTALHNGPRFTPQASAYLLLASSITFNAASSETETYSAWYGADSNSGTTTNIGTSGIYFLYDPANTNAKGVTGNTNNWWAVTDLAGTATLTDTGVAGSSSTRRFMIFVNGVTSATFYMDGVQVAQNTNNIPTGSYFMNRGGIKKSVGTTAVTMITDYEYHHARYASARTLP